MPRCLDRPRVALWVAPLALVIAMCVGIAAAQAAFPGANGRVAYLNDAAQIFVANADGTGVAGPLNPPDFPVSPPRLSPDGRQLVFSATITTSSYTTINVMVMSVDGSTSRWVTGEDPRTYDIWPDWTPDGRIVFSRTDASFVSGGIWSVAADGSGMHQLTTGQDQHVAVAPDGTLAFNRYPASGPGAIFVAGADGSAPHQLVNLPSNLQVDSANWAPDSSTVAFDVADPVNDTLGGIYVIKANGTGQKRILGNGAGSHPAFSPDGTRIAYTMPDASQKTGIGVMNADGSGSQMIAPPANGHTFLAPDWGVAVPAPSPPVATTEGPSHIGSTDMDLAGTVIDGHGLDTHYYFQYGPDLMHMPNHSPADPGTDVGSTATPSSPQPAFATLTGLQPRTTYCFRLVAYSSAGITYAHDAGSGDPGTAKGLCRQTNAPSIAPQIVTGSASSASPTSLHFTGTVNPESQPTTWFVQYSTYSDVSFSGGGRPAGVAGEVPVHEPGAPLPDADAAAHGVGTVASGLMAGTTYYFRLVAINGAGTSYGRIQSAGTTGPPLAVTGAATTPGDTQLHFTGTVNPGNDSTTTWYFQYSTDSRVNGARATPVPDPGGTLHYGDSTPHAVGADGLGLTPGTGYYYRLVAKNLNGVVYGQIRAERTTGRGQVSIDSMEVSQVSLSGSNLPARADADRRLFHGVGIPFAVPQVSQTDSLYAGGPSVARMFAHANVPATALLYAYENGRRLGTPVAPRTSAKPDLSDEPAQVKRREVNGGYTFDLPADWTRERGQSITLVGTLVPTSQPAVDACRTCNSLNGFAVRDVFFNKVLPLALNLVAMTDSPNRAPVSPTAAQTQELTSATSLLPTNVTTAQKYIGVVDTSAIKDTPGSQTANEQAHNALDNWVNAAHTGFPLGGVILGLSTRSSFNGVSEQTVSRGQIPISNVQMGAGRPLTSVAHELGHAIGLEHASSCAPPGSDVGRYDAWPPDQKGYLQGMGLDLRSLSGDFYPLIGNGGDVYHDFMSYCANVAPDTGDWISPRNWDSIISLLHNVLTPAGAADRPRADAAAADGLVVHASASAGHVVINSVSPGGGQVAGAPSTTHLVAMDASGHQLADVAMAEVASHADPATRGTPASAIMFYSATVPAGAASVQMRQGVTVLASRVRSAHAPLVRVLAPARRAKVGRARRAVVRWSATDADRDPLQIAVDYSRDAGAHWRVIYLGPNRGHVALPSGLLAGSRRARIRVAANDGFTETSAVSGIFTAIGAPPTVLITSPRTGQAVSNDATLLLSGSATDDAGSPLRGASVRWLAGKRILGTGDQISLTGLAPGRRTITFRARDRLGRVTSKTVTVKVHAAAPRLLSFSAPSRLSPKARSLKLKLASLIPSTARIGGAKRRLSSHVLTWVLPVEPGRRRLSLRLTLTAYGATTRVSLLIRR